MDIIFFYSRRDFFPRGISRKVVSTGWFVIKGSSEFLVDGDRGKGLLTPFPPCHLAYRTLDLHLPPIIEKK